MSTTRLILKPISWKDACQFIKQHHRHHIPSQGSKFSISCYQGERLCGVVVVGRPVNRALDDGWTAEVVRLATDGTYNACSMLYGAAARVAKHMGYRLIITYILKASGWTLDKEVLGGGWSGRKRAREDKHPVGPKQRWKKQLQPLGRRNKSVGRASSHDEPQAPHTQPSSVATRTSRQDSVPQV